MTRLCFRFTLPHLTEMSWSVSCLARFIPSASTNTSIRVRFVVIYVTQRIACISPTHEKQFIVVSSSIPEGQVALMREESIT